MKHYLLILCGLFLGLFGCQERTITMDLMVEPKPVVIAFLDTLWGVRAFVGQTVNPLSKPDTSRKNAAIYLYENDLQIEKLQLSDENVYISSPNFRPKPTFFYSLKVATPYAKDTVFSEKIQLNAVVPIQQISYVYTDLRKVAINLYVTIQDPIGRNGYILQVFRNRNDTIFDEPLHSKRTMIPPQNPIYSDKTFEGQRHTFMIENISIERRINNKSVVANEIRVALFNISKPMFDFWNTLNIPEPTTGDLFFDPNTFSNQMQNGIGIFGTYQVHEKRLKL